MRLHSGILLTGRLIGGYNEPSLEEYTFFVTTVPLVFSVAPLCDGCNTDLDSMENL